MYVRKHLWCKAVVQVLMTRWRRLEPACEKGEEGNVGG